MQARFTSKRWLILPAALILLAAVLLICAVMGFVGLFRQESVPLNPGGDTHVQITLGGRYEIFYEFRFPHPQFQDVSFTFTRSDGQVVPCRYPVGSAHYTLGATRGMLVGVTELEPGDYTVRGNAGDDTLTFVLRQGSLAGRIVKVVLSVFVGGGLLLAGVTLLVILLVHRSSVRKRPAPPVSERHGPDL